VSLWNCAFYAVFRLRRAKKASPAPRLPDGGGAAVRDFLKEKESLENPITLQEICRFGLKILAAIIVCVLGVRFFLE